LPNGGAKRRLSSYVVDASAVLAVLNAEPGSELLNGGDDLVISAVNLSEVVAKLADDGTPPDSIRQMLLDLKLDVRDFGAELALQAVFLRAVTRPFGLSLGDRACLSLGRALSLPVFTTDRIWRQVSVGVDVRLLR
jgi:PIN domain nuclease of toxin-antitoxin system